MSRGRRYDDTPKLNMKKVVATIIAIVVLVMFCMSLKNLLTRDVKKAQEISTLTTYFSIYENNKWGVMDNKGNIIIDPSYEEMVLIPDENTDLFVCTYNVNYNDETFDTKVLNAENEEILTEYDNLEVMQNTDGINVWYEKDILKYEKDGKYGLIDFEGKEVLPAEYDDIYVLDGIEKSLIIEKNGNKGLISSSTGEIIISATYKEISALSENYKNGYIVKNSSDKCGIIAIDKKVILEEKYDEIKNVSGNGYYVVVSEKDTKVVDKEGKVILEEGFDSVEAIGASGIVIINKDKYGVISFEGKEIISAKYEDIKLCFNNSYIAKKDGKYGILDSEENVKVEFEYENMAYIKTADFIEAETSNYKTDIYDSNLSKVLENVIISELNEEEGYLRVRKDNDYKYYNFKFEEKTNFDVLSTNTLFLYKENGKYGYKNKEGEKIVDPIYDDAKEQNEFGYCAVQKNGLWGALKSDGTVVLTPSVNLDDYLYVDFIEKWHRTNDLSLNTYIK